MAGRASSSAKAAAAGVAGGGPGDPVADGAAALEYQHSRGIGGQDPGGDAGGSKGVLLAIAILLLWLAAFAFFVAFEGTKLLGSDSQATGAGLFKSMMSSLAQTAAKAEQGQGGS